MIVKVDKVPKDILYTVVFSAYATTDFSKNPFFFKVTDITKDQLDMNFKVEDFIEVYKLNASPEDIIVQKIVVYPQVEFTSAWFLN